MSDKNVYHQVSIDEIYQKFKTGAGGLSPAEAKARLREHGRNVFPSKPPQTILSIFLHQFLNPLIYVLGVAAVVAAMLGDLTDAFFILLVLLINAVIGTIQEYGAERSALALKEMSASRAIVMRDGVLIEINAEELIPGDVVSLESGNKVPADLRLISSHHLEVDESLLTGESRAVIKDEDHHPSADSSLGDRKNMAFTGSIVMKGRGKGVIVGTGFSTELGKIAEAISFSESAKPPLIIRMEVFTKKLTIYLVFVTIVMAAYLLFYKGQSWHEVLMFSVALAVSAIPEGLPVALTIALAMASRRMSKRNVIVRKLPAVESLGSCTFIASDKTGTLTVNQLTVTQVYLPAHKPLLVTGTGLDPEGSVRVSEEENQPVENLHKLAKSAVLCNEAQLFQRGDHWEGNGDAVDLAFLVLSYKAGLPPDDFRKMHEMIQEIPYEPENKFAATMQSADGYDPLISVKGALEKLLTMCKNVDGETVTKAADAMAEEGLRILAVAGKTTKDKTTLLGDQLKDLELYGLVGMMDPLRSDALDAVAACHKAGIQVAMVTGDHPKTSLAIARELGLAKDSSEVVSGPELRDCSEEERTEKILNARVFARVDPKQKLEIVSHLIDHGRFVAVTGDGANDAPALKKANVGIAMGLSGTDVAKETSDLIITDDKFSSIVAGIEEGRIAYGNIRKVVSLLVTTGAAEILMFALALLFDTPLPLTAIQLLWLNLVTNGIQHIGIAFEPGEGDELSRHPRHPNEPIFDRLMIERIIISALVIGGISFWQFTTFLDSGVSLDEARNYTLLLMVLFENVMVGNCRSELRSIFKMNPLNNPILFFGTVGAQLVHIASMYIPSVSGVVGMTPVDLSEWTRLLAWATSVLFVMELYKYFRTKLRPLAVWGT